MSCEEIEIESNVLSKLILAKNFYNRASENSASRTALSRMVAIHHYHISIEITLRAIVSHFDMEGYNPNCGFIDLLGLIRNNVNFKSAGGKLPHQSRIKTVNQRRNDVQHNFLDPSPDVVTATAVDSLLFLKDAFSNIFAREYEDINELSLISHGQIRRILEISSKHLKSGNFIDSAKSTAVAFELALSYTNIDGLNDIGGDINCALRSMQVNSNDIANTHSFEQLGRELENMGEAVLDNSKILKIMLAGVDMKKYSDYLNKKPNPVITMGGSVFFPRDHLFEIEKESATTSFEFVTETVLRIQTENSPRSLESLQSEVEEYIMSESEGLSL